MCCKYGLFREQLQWFSSSLILFPYCRNSSAVCEAEAEQSQFTNCILKLVTTSLCLSILGYNLWHAVPQIISYSDSYVLWFNPAGNQAPHSRLLTLSLWDGGEKRENEACGLR